MSSMHRHGQGPEHDHEPVPGLPERPPPDEHLIWQGAPDWRILAAHVFHVHKVAAYFAMLLLLRAAFVLNDGGGVLAAVQSALWLLPLACTGVGLLLILAWLSARGTVYTLTNRRVVMRIGIVLTVTFNLPYLRIVAADLSPGPRGHGDIALRLNAADQIGWLHLWPHVRPWKLARAQPMLRCVPEAATVAALLGRAWAERTGTSLAQAAAEPPPARAVQPSLVGS